MTSGSQVDNGVMEIAECEDCGREIPFVGVGEIIPEDAPRDAQVAVEWWSIDWEDMITEVRCVNCEIGVWI